MYKFNFVKKVITTLLVTSIIGGSFLLNPIEIHAADAGTDIIVALTPELLNSETVTYKSGDSVITITDSTKENYLKRGGTNSTTSKTLVGASLIQNGSISICSADEVLRYKTVTATQSIKGTSIKTIIGVEVAYVYNIGLGKVIAIDGLGNPYIRVSGPITDALWDGSDPTVTKTTTSARISFTGSAYVGVSNSISGGLEAAGFSVSASTSTTVYLWSPVVTQVMNIYLSSL